jgi:hypothetical protein
MLTKDEQIDLLKFLGDPAKEFAYFSGWQLRGLNFRPKETSWLLVVKATDNTGKHLVAFIENESMSRCLSYLAMYVYKERVPLRWSVDRYS